MRFNTQFSEVISDDFTVISSESPVVDGQSISNAELFRRLSQGLPVGCATTNFNGVNPRADKLSTIDAIRSYQLRHGMLNNVSSAPAVASGSATVETEKVSADLGNSIS